MFDDEQAPESPYRSALEAFGELAATLNETRDRDTLLRLIARRVCELVGIERASVYLRDDESGLYRGQVGWSRASQRGAERDAQPQIKRLVAGTEADEFTREIVTAGRPVVVSDTRTDPRPVSSAMRPWRIRSMLGVPMVLGGEVIGILFLGNGDNPHAFSPTEIEIAATFADLAAVVISQAQMTGELRRSLQTVARQNDLLRRTAEIDDRLTERLLAGGGFGQIAETISELTGKPCEIYDAAHQRLAMATPRKADGEPEPRPFDADLRSHPQVRQALERLGEKGSGVVGPLPEAGLTHRYLYSPIMTHGDVWGSLVIIEHGSRFGPLDRQIARRAAMSVALELAAERRAARAEWDARASLAAELIRGTSDPGPIVRRAQYLGVDLGAPHVVCIICAQPERALPTVADFAAAFPAQVRGVMATAVADGVLIILRIDTAASRHAAMARARVDVQKALEHLRTEAILLAAIASPCTDVEGYVNAYEEARQVMSCLRSLLDGDRSIVLTADDLGPLRVFLASSSHAEVQRMAEDAIGPLLRSGDDAKGNLLRTLEAFFETSRSVRNAARKLGVHENTIRYRLARIRKLTGLAIGSDSFDELIAHVALLVLRMQRLATGGDVDSAG